MQLQNLEGVKKKLTDAKRLTGISKISRLELRENVLTTAGDKGALNIWLDDDGFFRGEIFRYLTSQDKIATKKLVEIKAFASKWLKKIY